MPDAAELAAHEEYLRQIAAQQFLSADERIAHRAYMASRSWAEKDRQEKRGRGRPRIKASEREARMMGYCGKCRVEPLKVRPNGDAYARCEECHGKAIALQRGRARRLRQAGICTRCNRRQAAPDKQHCHDCAEAVRAKQVGGRPRKFRRVPVDEDDGLKQRRTIDDQAVWDAHRAAINAVTNLSNARPDDPDLRRAARALYSSGALLAEEMR